MNIIELAKKAGLVTSEHQPYGIYFDALERFAALVRAEVEAEWIENNKALAKEIIVKNEALKLAEEALKNNLPFNYVQNNHGEKFPCFSNDPLREAKTREALAAIHEALANPDERGTSRYEGWVEVAEPVKQEPVAFDTGDELIPSDSYLMSDWIRENCKPLYAAPVDAKAIDFDEWMKNPYTVVLQKSIKEDYIPATDAKAIRADALEEAAELGDSMDPLQDGAIGAAIRGLK